ncbi:hypothetical protein [Xanthomonas hortorum]|uniref:hypothetical protein n=1 Tax=Xanthomonas hortorum TaxID=56454 RepID=UPI001E3AC6DE|nr:hypothetical protein [Xanthomonas hortorum]MCC8552554.1 hypothetical protein [Xanthomonas hortorum pv. gardneri]MCE4364306.1 hypothetical protein [Xanthomonas hortorum]
MTIAPVRRAIVSVACGLTVAGVALAGTPDSGAAGTRSASARAAVVARRGGKIRLPGR